MSPTLAEATIGLIVIVLVFMLGVQLVPLIMAYLSTDDAPPSDEEDIERQDDEYET